MTVFIVWKIIDHFIACKYAANISRDDDKFLLNLSLILTSSSS